MNDDQTLSDPPTPAQADTPFHQPAPVQLDGLSANLTISEILERAKLPERRARICLAADLQGRYDEIVDELSVLVNASGELIVDPEATIGAQTPAGRAQQLADDLEDVRRQMSSAMASFLFRGMPADDLAVFEKKHKPTDPKADHTDYWVQMIARCAVTPAMTTDDVTAFRKKLGANAFWQLVEAVRGVNLGGGVDVPKSLSFSQVRTAG